MVVLSEEIQKVVMIFFLCLIAIAASDAARITRGIEHPHFPNLHTVHHGNGATSYQNVQIESHNHVAVPSHYEVQHASSPSYHELNYPKFFDLSGYPKQHELPITPIVEESDDIDYISEAVAPFNEVVLGHEKIKDAFPHYQHYEHAHNYGYN